MIDLWIAQPVRFIDVALEEGFRKFSWNVATLIGTRLETLSWLRVQAMGYSDVRLMIISHGGAAEYDVFSSYDVPCAVYPTWDTSEDWNDLEWIIKNPPGNNPDFYNDTSIPVDFRPIKDQRNRVVVHRLPPSGEGRQEFFLRLRELQLANPQCEIFIDGCTRFNTLFGMGFKAANYLPAAISFNGMATDRIHLPSGKVVMGHLIHDKRYADWFELLGFSQFDIVDSYDQTRYCLRAAAWANKNFDSVKPFVVRMTTGGGSNTVYMPSDFMHVKDRDFVLPAARRTAMRNVGMYSSTLDKFSCDTCMIQNACTLYREGSVCVLKGSETVNLADAFGSRSASVIMDGLTELLKRQAGRLEDAMSAEDASGKLDPEVTKLASKVFDQGVKLAKLRDPSLSGTKVQVNVGVGSGGQANVSVSGSDPKQLMASVVAELEEAGIARADITSDMIKGVLKNMANVSQPQAISAAKVTSEIQKHKEVAAAVKVIEGNTA